MSQSGVPLSVRGLTKRFGRDVVAVNDLSFHVQPGRVTGFLGPNGSGKTTTLRCMLSLVWPTAGTALIGDQPYSALEHPAKTVGAALEASSFHPARRGIDHLRVVAAANAVPASRAEECLEQVGLSDAARRKVGGYSLGMRQRLALATALLGDPGVLILDEPANGLDPEGIAWLRKFLRYLASEGRTVLVSSHALAEIQQSADDVVIIKNGNLVAADSIASLMSRSSASVIVRTERINELRDVLTKARASWTNDGEDGLQVAGLSAAEVGRVANEAHIALTELRASGDDLESIFLQLTGEDAS